MPHPNAILATFKIIHFLSPKRASERKGMSTIEQFIWVNLYSLDLRSASHKFMEEILIWKIMRQAWYFARILVQLYSDKLLKTFLLLWQKLNWQNISICKCEFFKTLMWKTFCHLVIKAYSIENNLRACNSWTGCSVSYKFVNWFWLNLPYPNSKMFSTSNVKNNSHLQMDIF